jgi:hypothetical protein
MGGFLVMNFDDRSCTYHYPVYHHRLHVIETALQAGDRVSFLAPDLAGQVCGGYGIEIVDLRHDGKLVLRQHSQRAVRALWGAALLALGLATLLWWVRGVRRRA